jgi:mRNA-degrading endonuclease toxin of MazEF toxin-antitoxin module
VERGTICFTTMVGGLDHDQGTRPVLVIGRTAISDRMGETIVLPISHVEPIWRYPLSWQLPTGILPQPSWVLVSRPRAAVVSRLRDAVAVLAEEHVDEITAALVQLIQGP